MLKQGSLRPQANACAHKESALLAPIRQNICLRPQRGSLRPQAQLLAAAKDFLAPASKSAQTSVEFQPLFWPISNSKLNQMLPNQFPAFTYEQGFQTKLETTLKTHFNIQFKNWDQNHTIWPICINSSNQSINLTLIQVSDSFKLRIGLETCWNHWLQL